MSAQRTSMRTSTRRIFVGLAVGTAVVVATVIGATAWLRSGQPIIPGLPDAGALVTLGSPVLRALTAAAGVVTVALLVLALSVDPVRKGGAVSRLGRRDSTLAARAAGAWTVLALLQAMWVFADVLAMPLPDAWAPQMVAAFWWEVPQIRSLLLIALLTAVAAAIASVSTRVVGVGAALALSGAAIVLPTISGHASSSTAHALLLTSSTLHSLAASTWIAIIAALCLVATRGEPALAPVVSRLARVAVVAAVLLALSGIGNAAAQLNTWSELVSTTYGRIVLLKAAALIGAALAGYLAQRRLLRGEPSASSLRRRYAIVAAVEALALIVAFGGGSALAASAPPRTPVDLPTLAETLAGFAFPPPPSFVNVVLTIRPDPLFLLAGLAAGALYLVGVARLRRRGDAWPWGRTISWLLGVAAFLWATNAGIAAYANIAAGLHMGQHMALTMLIPILLVMGAPATLALRALRPRSGAGWGPREWLVYALHCPVAVVLTNPLVVMVLYFAGLYGLYLSGLFGSLMGSHVGHVAMQTHFVLSGYLFYWILIGIDPRPRLLPYWQRFMLLVISSALHGFFAVIIMMSEAPVAAEWFSAVQPPWVTDLLQDTVLGGQAAWAIGEFPLLIVAIALAVQWSRSDERDARRMDRQADRDGGQELASYNAYLAQLHARDSSSNPPSDPEAQR